MKDMLTTMWFDVKNPVFNFTGREKELFDLKKALEETKDNQSTMVITQSVSISGVGGVGKTELAKQFIFLHSSEYENVIWINAESYMTMSNSFRRLAFNKLRISMENSNGKLKSFESIVSEVYDFLRGKRTLFIFDNADRMRVEKDGDFGIQNFMPRFPSKNKYYTLITSRNSQWEDLNKIKLEKFTEEEAIDFIGKSIDLNEDQEKFQAKILANSLQLFPLALQHAITYIKASQEDKSILGQNFNILDYLTLFQKANIDIVDFPFQSDGSDSYTKSVYTTCKITLDDIHKKPHGKIAADLLSSISYFAPDDISVENISSVLGVTTNSDLMSSLKILKQYSMVTTENEKVSEHGLVQLVIRMMLKEEGKEMTTLRRLLVAGPELDAEHAVSVWQFSCSYSDLVEEFGHLPSHIVDALDNSFKLEEACSFGKQSITNLTQRLGDKHTFVLKVKESLARVLGSFGNYEEALKEYDDLYEKYKKALGECHYKTLKIKHYIADMLYNLGNYYEALDYYKNVYGKISAGFGEDDPDSLDLKLKIANVLCNLGEHTQALKSYREVYEKLKSSLGENDSKTLTTKQNIAYVLEKIGDYYEALNYYQEIYKQAKTTLHKDHPLPLTMKQNMASVLDKLGRHKESLHAYQDVHKIYETKYGQLHPDSINAEFNISNVFFKLEKYDEALKSYESVLEKIRDTYGVNHEKTLHVKFCIAQVLYNLKENEKALCYYQEIYCTLRESFGENHDKVLQAKQCIANTLYNLGAYDKALQSSREIYEQIKLDLGDHPKTVSIKEFMADTLYKLGKYQEAFNAYKEVHQKMRIIYGEWHEKTLIAQQNMASVLLKLGKADESLSCFEDVYDKQRAFLGDDHKSTRQTKENMAVAWHSLKKLQYKELEHNAAVTNGHPTEEQSTDTNQNKTNLKDQNAEAGVIAEDHLTKAPSKQNNIIIVIDNSSPFYLGRCTGCLKRYAYTCTLQ